MKQCRKCKVTKSSEDFYKRPIAADGLDYYCKECQKADKKERRRKDPETHRIRVRKWQEENPDYPKEYRLIGDNGKKAIAIAKQWSINNRQRSLDIGAKAGAKRRALIEGVETDPTVSLAEAIIRAGSICGICKLKVKREEASIDHIHPISKGGTHTWDNIQLAHGSCNSRKGVAVA